MIQDLDIFGLKSDFFFGITLRVSKKIINIPINLALIIVNLIIVLRERLSLANLLRAHVFHIYKTALVIVVYKNKNLILTIF